MPINDLVDDFAFLEDWEDRYRYVIELGKTLEPLSEAEHSSANKVQGCVSQVWLTSEARQDAQGKLRLYFRGDSDAFIVRGLVAILLRLYNGLTPAGILAVDARATLEGLGLNEHLSPQRSNGLYSMVSRIRHDAEVALADTAN